MLALQLVLAAAGFVQRQLNLNPVLQGPTDWLSARSFSVGDMMPPELGAQLWACPNKFLIFIPLGP